MFATAPRYLSGVSVFYGDDITSRTTTGEVVIAVGPSAKGPRDPIALKTIDNAVPIYGTNSPLVKALYEFNDGYIDSPALNPIRYVALRVGGIPATLTTSYGLALTTVDAYDGIENEFYVYADNTTAENAKVKVWNGNKMLVYDSAAGVDTGYVTVTSTPAGDGGVGAIYGKDIDNDPLATPFTIADIVAIDLTIPGGVKAHPTAAPGATSVAIVTSLTDVSYIPLSGKIYVTAPLGATTIGAYANYTFNAASKTFTLAAPLGVDFSAVTDPTKIDILFVGSTLVNGDSELNLDARVLYEKIRNALLDVEQYTPDYILPAGVTFDQSYTYSKTYTENTLLVEALAPGAAYVVVDAAAKWPKTGTVIVDDGTTNQTLNYTDILVYGENYKLVLANGQTITAAAANTSIVTNEWVDPNAVYELGIGYVKETDLGGEYAFEWSDVQRADYSLAHFGYLFANFCNNAAVGYNTPLCAMNVTAPTSLNRADIVKWIGTAPKTKIVAGVTDAVEAVTENGTGLLGDAVLQGSTAYNRCNLSDKANNDFADPAFGLLMTDTGYIDGRIVRDSSYKLVDLGKFLGVGSGLMTFSNRASGTSYIDTCGIYALGVLAGCAKNEGISFRQIGQNSGASVTAIIHRRLAEELAGAGYIVITREQGLGWVINNDPSAARAQSAYVLLSTTRTVKTVVEAKRAALSGFIGKPLNKYNYEAARTKLADLFAKDVADGFLRGYQFDLQIAEAAKAIGKLYLKCVLNPPLELTEADVDTTIDRSIIS